MGQKPIEHNDNPGPSTASGGTARRVRADAQRNIDAVREAAKAVFADSGVDAPVREIAARAGVGLGTVYRHFPQRSDLVVAVFRHEIDACADAAATLAAEHEPGEALARWLRRYAEFVATKRGLAAALHSGDPAFSPLPAYFDQRLRPALGSLLEAAAASGEVRADVDPNDLLRAVGNLCLPAEDDRHAQRMVDLLIDGLRYGADAHATVRPPTDQTDNIEE
ncbi:TetR/AcrR family transcriptional regulator [Nocardia amamiensis]|uniref:TetR/AcrR family transcriptional regulator n=1 Tax=Nocardia amamiensis TaxID=404578 RepID=UPI0009FBC123|nr:TetR/AcrR family transcriptional regulator [Nocardia amamiensis]